MAWLAYSRKVTSSGAASTTRSATSAGWRLEHTYADLPALFHTPVAPTPVLDPQFVVFNTVLATGWAWTSAALDSAGRRRHFRRQRPARRRAAAGAGLRRPPVRPLHRPRRRPRHPAGRADHPGRPPRGRAAQRRRTDAVFPPRRRTRGARPDAAGAGDQRGHARAGHPHVARPRGGRHRPGGAS